jgi:hypothetical protein
MGDTHMKGIQNRRNIALRTFVVCIIMGLVIVPGFSLAGAFSISPDGTPHKPAFITSKEDLVTVQIVPRQAPSHPLSPVTTDVNIVELLQQLTEPCILGYLENLTGFGPRETGTEACDQAARYLYATFQDMGLAVRYHNYTDNTVSGSNIEATLYGSDSTNIFLICGHYDSVAAGPGADDDGSGVAVVLAAAEIMRHYEFGHTVRFVCFSGEEQGLIGSRHYAEDAYNNNDSIVAVLNADMIGFAPSASDGIYGKVFENTASEWIVSFTQNISQIYSEYIGIELFPQGETWGSDHYYFWEYGYDAVFYHEYHFNSYYHSANDTIEHMNITYATRFSRLILATLAEMAQQPRPVLKISDISGGLGVAVQITNIGNENANDVIGQMSITGGVLHLVNVNTSIQSAVLSALEPVLMKKTLFGLGRIQIAIAAVASNADQVTKHASAFLFGPFVVKVVAAP